MGFTAIGPLIGGPPADPPGSGRGNGSYGARQFGGCAPSKLPMFNADPFINEDPGICCITGRAIGAAGLPIS